MTVWAHCQCQVAFFCLFCRTRTQSGGSDGYPVPSSPRGRGQGGAASRGRSRDMSPGQQYSPFPVHSKMTSSDSGETRQNIVSIHLGQKIVLMFWKGVRTFRDMLALLFETN